MIIFGTRGITTTPEKGEFDCPTCKATRPYGLKRVRRFFTLYFIPLIPLDKLGEYVECGSCKDTYKPIVLQNVGIDYGNNFEAEYFSAIKKVMIHMLLADGIIDVSEIDEAMNIYLKITDKDIDEDQFRAEIDDIKRSKEPMGTLLTRLQGSLNSEGKEMVIRAALAVAMADGEFQEEEQVLITEIAQDLGMTPAHLKGVMAGG